MLTTITVGLYTTERVVTSVVPTNTLVGDRREPVTMLPGPTKLLPVSVTVRESPAAIWVAEVGLRAVKVGSTGSTVYV